MVSVLPFHRPIDVAEEYAMLDQLLGGRLNLGVGSGYIPMEFEGFGVDPTTKRERFESGLDTILTAFRGGSVRAHEGAPPVRLNVLPVQQPHPPIWIAAQRREAIPFVARRGVSIALIPYATLSGLDELGAVVREFRENALSGNRSRSRGRYPPLRGGAHRPGQGGLPAVPREPTSDAVYFLPPEG